MGKIESYLASSGRKERTELLAKEKAFTKMRDELPSRRRRDALDPHR